MLLIDISQTIVSNFFVSIKSFPEIDEDSIRYQVLNSIAFYKRKFSHEYGELIVCCDSPPFWRKNVYPYYKANRTKSQEKSLIDWKKIKLLVAQVVDELDENFPYRVVRTPGAEGDDVIATIVEANSLEVINNNNKILICSADKDLCQLQKYPNVEQYDPIFKKAKMTTRNPETFLREHIIRGDSGDGIPNILSSDDCLVMGVRQKPILEKKLESWRTDNIESFCDEKMLRNYKRNERLIDLTFIPEDIKKNILEVYDNQKNKSKSGIVPYIVKHKLSKLMTSIGDF